MGDYYGCGDSSCVFGPPGGMHTNGGCQCLQPRMTPGERARVRQGITAAQARIRELEELVYVPGVWLCAKCGLRLVSTTMSALTGATAPNRNPQQCPNECGPMWRESERDARKGLVDDLDRAFSERDEARAEAKRLTERSNVWFGAAERQKVRIAQLETALELLCNATVAYVVHNGGQHENPNCPEDDTCDCPLVQALETALGGARRALEKP